MYMVKARRQNSFYQDFTPRTVRHKDAEIEVYVSNVVTKEVSRNMKAVVKDISAMVVHGLSLKED